MLPSLLPPRSARDKLSRSKPRKRYGDADSEAAEPLLSGEHPALDLMSNASQQAQRSHLQGESACAGMYRL